MSNEKKGLHPLAWVGIGCGVLVVLAVIAVVGGGMFVANKAKTFVEESEGNPGKAIAEMAVRLNPEIDLVSSDDDAGTMTIRNKKSGEEVTLNWDDIKEGKFSITTSEGTTSIDASGAADSGSVTITSPDGEARFGAGADASDLPSWVPLYPGSAPEGAFTSASDDKVAGSVGFKTTDSLDQVAEHFETALKGAGYEVKTQAISGDGANMRFINGSHTNGRTVNATATRTDEGTTQVAVTYEGQP